jgi:single-strand DNA-binding protein
MGLENSCQFIGHLFKDMEVRFVGSDSIPTASGRIICNSRFGKDKQGKPIEKKTGVNLVAWRGLATMLGEWGKKGKHMAVSGRYQERSYEKGGETKYISEVILSDVKFLPNSNGNGNGNVKLNTNAPPEEVPPPDFVADDSVPF